MKQFFHGEADVPGDLAELRGRDITAGVKRDGGAPTIRVTVLSMRPALPDFLEAEAQQESGNFTWLEDWHRGHDYATMMV